MGNLDTEKLQSYAVPLAQLINFFQIIWVKMYYASTRSVDFPIDVL